MCHLVAIFWIPSADVINSYAFSVTTNFDAPVVDLEVILILQPLTGRNGRNICDVPVIARQTVTIDFGGEGTLNI